MRHENLHWKGGVPPVVLPITPPWHDRERGERNATLMTLNELATALGVSHVELVRQEFDD
jgi:hypothetical protein